MKKNIKKTASKKNIQKSKKIKKVNKPALLEKTKTKQSIIENVEDIKISQPILSEVVIERLPFELCAEAFDFLSYCFQPDGFEDENGEFFTDDRFVGMWKMFLTTAGYTEAEYWDMADNNQHDHVDCEECRKEREEQEAKEKETKDKNVN